MIPRHIQIAVQHAETVFADPGVNWLGWAHVSDHGWLRAAGVFYAPGEADVTASAFRGAVERLATDCGKGVTVVCERMVTRGKGSPLREADLLNVQLVAGKVGDYYVSPQQWKGSITRSLEQRRTKSKLTDDELDLELIGCNGMRIRDVTPKSEPAHNALSAVGIAVSVLGRKALR